MAGPTQTISRPSADNLPGTPIDRAWDEAFLRVEGYLRAHRLESPVLLNQIAAEIIQEARAAAESNPREEPVGLAMEAAQARIGAWFARAGMKVDWTNERMRARGRLALVLADLPGHWSNTFLSPDPVPDELAAAMAEVELLPGPELHFSNMSPEVLEFGSDEGDTPYPPARNLWLLLRAVGSWLLVVGFFGIAWAASH